MIVCRASLSVVLFILKSMTAQLRLLPDFAPDWKIPEATKQLGRRGVAEAREVLQRIPRRFDDGTTDGGSDTSHRPAA